MYNVLIQGLPEEYEGFTVNTDFETGILIMQTMEDTELSEFEQQYKAIELLFDGLEAPEDFETAMAAVQWFLTGWNQDHHSSDEENSEVVMNMDADQWRIYSAFRAQYRINLLEESLHFWEFMALLTTLEECSFTRVVDIRGKKVKSNMSLEEKKALWKAKKIYAIKEERKENRRLTKAEEEFLKYANIKKNKKNVSQ